MIIQNNEMLSVAAKLMNEIDKFYLLNNVNTRVNDEIRTLKTTMTINDDGAHFVIDCNIPYPDVSIMIREIKRMDEHTIDMYDSNLLVELTRNCQTVAIFNECFSQVYTESIISFIKSIVADYKKLGNFENSDNFIIQ